MDEHQEAGVEEEGQSAPSDTGVEAEGSGAPQNQEDDTDWRAIAEKERERAENYKQALTQKRQLRNVQNPVVEEEDDDAPLTRKSLKELLHKEVVPLVASSKEDSLLSSKIQNPEKRAFVKQILESRIVRTGTSDDAISADIEAAIAIADSKKKDKVISELARAAQNKPPLPTAGSSTDKPIEQKAYKWSAEEARALENKAKLLGVDPEKFKADAWKNQQRTKVLS